ncbi:hypothetical protein Glove_349g33 [Diversispora epigaea]|uniref:Uncharacterized protein n=1 Tax=Diversispora epigaea TaxID=1348612 RepID=A0A397HI57_9GLOM|nr:hypothetical protein Glove_349g33 [Diversispora epigaea]
MIGLTNCNTHMTKSFNPNIDTSAKLSQSKTKVNAQSISQPKVSSPVTVSPSTKSQISNSPISKKISETEILEQCPDLYKEFSSENVDYYGITAETLCPLCNLDHDGDEDIEGKYKDGSYYIKCEKHETEITA